MRRLVAIGSVLAVLACVAAPAHASHISCGQTITTNTTLDSDLACSSSPGITIGANGVDFDLGGHTIRGGIVIYADRRRELRIHNGFVIGSSPIDLYRVDASTVEDLDVAGRIRLGGQPDDNVVRNNVVRGGGGPVDTAGIEVSEDFQFGNETFRPANNRVEDNVSPDIYVQLSDRNMVRGNEITGGSINLAGSGDPPHFFEGNGPDENVVEDNLVHGSSFPGYGILLAQACNFNSVEGNEVRGGSRGIFVTTGCADNVVRGNQIDGARGAGIQLGDSTYRTARNLIEGNVITGGEGDGIGARVGADANVLRGNVVSGQADDGIDVEDPSATVASNFAYENGDWGVVAVPSVTDGGGNRAWSNGQAAQCLNVVCGPGPPASVSLSPESATNTVGDQHCVTATVADPDRRPTPGVTVRFSIDDDGSAAEQTDAGGTATFCYDGPLAAATQLITAFADADADSTQDADEPSDTATKTWVVPASNSCRVAGKGALTAANGDEATFDLNVRTMGSGRLHGRHTYRDLGPAERLTARSRAIEALTCTATMASIFGTAIVTGSSQPVRFRIDVGESPDTYRIRLADGYDSGEAAVSSGKIRLR